MHTFTGHQQYGFTTMVILSTILHLTVFIPYFYLKETSRRIFITPVYTVDLVSLPRERPEKEAKKKRTVSKAGKKAKKKVIKKSNLKKEKAKRVAAITPQVEKIKEIEKEKKIAEALKEIEREARLREEDLKTKKIIEGIQDREKKKEEETKLRHEFERLKHREETEGIADLKEKVERLERKRRIRELDLKALDSVKKIMESERLKEEDIRSSTTASVTELPIGKSIIADRGENGSKILDIRFADYYIKIWERIQGLWILPESISEDLRSLETIIGIKIGRDGGILEKRIEKSSGNTKYDESTLRAIGKSDPLPPLPEGFRGKVFEVGIRFRDFEPFNN